MTIEELKAAVPAEVDRQAPALTGLSHKIHSNPELGFHEHKASGWLAEYLISQGFSVQKSICGMATAFRAVYGTGRPAVALLAEFDALPQLGHGCGHNIIGVAAAGAGVASRLAVDRLGGSVLVFGTPAEELHGGKTIMAEQGAFSGLDAALLVHPGRRNASSTHSLACISLDVEFFGREAHAAAHPEHGINALEAMLLAYNAINSLRQHVRQKARIHGIITDGGKAANVVPGHSAGSFLVRAEEPAYLDELKGKVLACFQGAATATGARLEYRWGEHAYDCLKVNEVLAGLFAANFELLGRKVEGHAPACSLGSTDMGNVSQLVPAIHPTVAITSSDITVHSPEFALAAASEEGDRGLLDSAKALALTVLDLLADPRLVEKAWAEFSSETSAPEKS